MLLASATNPLIPVFFFVGILLLFVLYGSVISDHLAAKPPRILAPFTKWVLMGGIPFLNGSVVAAFMFSAVVSTLAIIGIIGALL